jgi:cyanophycinase-like exopeptidase
MPGLIALVGSGEFLPAMLDTDRTLLADRPGRVVHLPTAAGLESPDSIARWSQMAASHYAALGREVVSLPVIDDQSADDPGLAAEFDSEIALIYLSGGNPAYCAKTLRDSAVWDAIFAAWEGGASLAGCSAGAGALTTVAPNQMGGKTESGLGVVPNLAVIPHYDRARFLMPIFGRVIRNSTPPDAEVIGIEEDTALLGRPGEEWTVHGRQSVVLVDRHKQRLSAGESITFDS